MFPCFSSFISCRAANSAKEGNSRISKTLETILVSTEIV